MNRKAHRMSGMVLQVYLSAHPQDHTVPFSVEWLLDWIPPRILDHDGALSCGGLLEVEEKAI